MESIPGRRRDQFATGLLNAYALLEDESDEQMRAEAKLLGYLDDDEASEE